MENKWFEGHSKMARRVPSAEAGARNSTNRANQEQSWSSSNILNILISHIIFVHLRIAAILARNFLPSSQGNGNYFVREFPDIQRPIFFLGPACRGGLGAGLCPAHGGAPFAAVPAAD
jgi:hypothetical protein